MLAYLSRYTHRVAISNQRLIALDEHGVTFRWKDYRAKGRTRNKTMTLSADEFMRRFLLHVLPRGFHRIRHYGLIANGERKDNLVRARELLHAVPDAAAQSQATDASVPSVEPTFVCPHCGAAMIIIDIFAARTTHPRATSTSNRSMSARTSRCPNRSSTLPRIQSIGRGFVLRCDHVVSRPTRHPKVWRINPGSRHLSDVAGRLFGLIPRFVQVRPLKSP